MKFLLRAEDLVLRMLFRIQAYLGTFLPPTAAETLSIAVGAVILAGVLFLCAGALLLP